MDIDNPFERRRTLTLKDYAKYSLIAAGALIAVFFTSVLLYSPGGNSGSDYAPTDQQRAEYKEQQAAEQRMDEYWSDREAERRRVQQDELWRQQVRNSRTGY